MADDRSGWASEKLRAEMREKRKKMGLKFTRQLRVDEERAFVEQGIVPVSAVSASTFKSAKLATVLPQGMTCMLCGKTLERGYVVEVESSESPLRVVCEDEYLAISEHNEEERIESVTPAPATTVTPAPATTAGDPVAAALQTLTAALSAPKAPPFDEAKVIAEAVAQAKQAAVDETKQAFSKSLSDFLKDGTTPSVGGEEEEESLPSATRQGPDVAVKASGWTAKATPSAKDAVSKLTKFLSEFSYFRDGVSMRLINTFARSTNKKDLLKSYCEVSAMEDLPDLVEKMKSVEFEEVEKAFAPFSTPKAVVNNRFAVFYGPPGGGKTYAAIEACKFINGDGKYETTPCSPSMDAADMLYTYRLDYKSGKRGYVPTALLKAMLAGRAVVLDEINLLPMEARMFLQNILDNKEVVSVMGIELPIRKGFFVIGTMNLETGLGTSPLPLPLVDRACVVKEFKTSAAQAAVGAGLC